VKEEWKTIIIPDSIWVQRGIFLNQLTGGGRKKYTSPTVDDSAYCDWEEVNYIPAGRYVARRIKTTDFGDSLQIIEMDYIMYHFVICNNIGWEIQVTEKYLVKTQPPPLPEPVEELPPTLVVSKTVCLCLEVENFNSLGYTNMYPYLGTGGRVNFYPFCKCIFALDFKVNISGQAPYIPIFRSTKLSWKGMKNNTGVKLGVRFQTALKNKALFIIYLNIGKTRYDWRWDNNRLDKELEMTFLYKRLKLETLAFIVNDPGYLFSRIRAKWVLSKEHEHIWYLGPEVYYDGDNNLNHPNYYATRWGLVLEFFKPYKRGKWFSAGISGGIEVHEHYIASYAGIEACFGLQFVKKSKW